MTDRSRWTNRSLLALGTALGIAVAGTAGVASAAPSDQTVRSATSRSHGPVRYATIHNFADPDVLDGDDGLPASTAAPLEYGAPTLAVDDQGNGMEEHEATISYFSGTYYKYTSKWACGRIVYFAGTINGQHTANPTPGPSGGWCGIASYSSADLTTWHLDNISSPTLNGQSISLAKPNVVYSPVLNKYLMWVKTGTGVAGELAPTGGLDYAVADTPAGPWGNLVQATGNHLAHDFDIMVGPDGSGWITTDVFSGSYVPGTAALPQWDVWVQQLNPAMTGTVDTPQTQVEVMHKTDFEGIGFLQKDGHWYLTGGPTCGNCQAPIQYVMAASPLGPWSNENGDTGAALTEGTALSADGCGGQNKGANVLPSTVGDVVLEGIFGYRMGTTSYVQNGRVVHGDNSQAIASTYWIPLQFDGSHHILPLTCSATVKVPLANSVTHNVAAPAQYQPDCRVRSNASLVQTAVMPTGNASALRIPVFQRTDNLGPFSQDALVMNAPLTVDVDLPNGAHTATTFQPSTDLSWAAEDINVPLPRGAGAQRATVTLTTTATNGCYGVLVTPTTHDAAKASYTVIRDDVPTEAPAARLYIANAH
jgi:hypothetical protein